MAFRLILTEAGGTTVMDCPELNIRGREYPYREVTAERIKKAVEEITLRDDYDIEVVDRRPHE